jgi:hypothetical protein
VVAQEESLAARLEVLERAKAHVLRPTNAPAPDLRERGVLLRAPEQVHTNVFELWERG